MRRTQTITTVIVAVITVASLHFFLGPSYAGRWYHGRGYNDRYWNEGPANRPDRGDRFWNWRDAPSRDHRSQPVDSSSRPAY